MLGNIFILGDSYSTFQGYVPEGYGVYYQPDGPNYIKNNPDMKLSENDVCKVEQTWWYNLTKERGCLLKNCSWSGTTICHTGYNGSDCRENSFIGRMEKLFREGYFEQSQIDTFFLFGGTNDSWANAPLGEGKDSDWTTEDLYQVLPAFSYLTNLLVSKLHDTKIYCIINTQLKPEVSEYYQSVCKQRNIDCIVLHDIDKVCGHPTIKGMQQIKEQVLRYIDM